MNAPVENAAVDQTVLGQRRRTTGAACSARPIDLAIVLGTGLGGVAEAVQNPVIVPYSDIPGFPAADGVRPRRAAGRRASSRAGASSCMQGRAHYYETGDAAVDAHAARDADAGSACAPLS